MNKCKYFMSSICYSPHTINTFGGPSSEPVNNAYCLTERYRECKYFVEYSFDAENTRLYEAIGLKTTIDFYPLIHLITCDQTCECPFYKQIVVDEEKHSCVALCSFTDRYLTRSNVRKCISNWRECPFYKTSLEISS